MTFIFVNGTDIYNMHIQIYIDLIDHILHRSIVNSSIIYMKYFIYHHHIPELIAVDISFHNIIDRAIKCLMEKADINGILPKYVMVIGTI